MFSVSHYFLHDKLWKAKISKTIHLQVSVMHIKSHSGAASESYLWSVWLNGSFQHHWCSDQISTWNKRMVVSFIKKYIFFLLSSGNVVMFLQSTRCVSSLLYQMTILHTNPPTIEGKIMSKWYETKRLKKYMEHTSHYCLDNAWIVYNFCLSDKAYHASCSCHSPSVIDLILLTVLYVWHQLWCVLLPTDSHYDNIIQYTKEQSFCEYFPCRNEWEWDSNPIQANNSCLLPCSWET